MLKLALGALSVLVLLGLPVAADAAAGTAKGVNPLADAVAGGETRTLVVGSDVNIGDIVKTGPRGQVQILFADNTKLVVGPDSSLEIQDYLIRNNGSAGKLAVDMLAGSFRFVTGASPKSNYLINTPSGTIGVRGTGFDTRIIDKIAYVLMYDGVTIICDKLKKGCETLTGFCELGKIGTGETTIIGDARKTSGAQRDEIKRYFRYAMDEYPLRWEFRIAHAYDCLHRVPELNVPQALGTTGSGPGGTGGGNPLGPNLR
jgi:FecR-like protein